MFVFAWSIKVDFRKFLFLFVDFFVRMWLLYAFILLILPDPVFVKRFAAARFVFTFGIFLSS